MDTSSQPPTDESPETDEERRQGGEIISLPERKRSEETARDGAPREEGATLKGVIEALLFASDQPLSSQRLAELSEAEDGRAVREIVRALQREYEAGGRAFQIEEIAGGFQLLSRAEFAPWIGKLHQVRQRESLSQAALETLAIIAYRQPIIRAEIEDIRGVQSDYIVRSLMERGLVRVVGRSEELGRPLLHGTTRKFLQLFGLGSVRDLPRMDEGEARKSEKKQDAGEDADAGGQPEP